jgi:hypothetical protein
MISFRVSEQEFELLKTKSESEGARTISEYARLALCRAGRVPYERVDPAVSQLTDEIQQLRAHVIQIAELLANPKRTAIVRLPITLAARKTGRA